MGGKFIYNKERKKEIKVERSKQSREWEVATEKKDGQKKKNSNENKQTRPEKGIEKQTRLKNELVFGYEVVLLTGSKGGCVGSTHVVILSCLFLTGGVNGVWNEENAMKEEKWFR